MNQPTCPYDGCTTTTEWMSEFNTSTGELNRFAAMCDSCQADQAVTAAFEGTNY